MNTSDTTGYSEMQLIKRRFFAMRNGVIADALRKGSIDYPIIFGLNIPQIAEIADEQDARPELAEQLWADVRTRESRLMAPMVYPVAMLSRDDAERWLTSARNVETADILCHRLLRHHPDAVDIALAYGDNPDAITRYTARRLMLNLLAVSSEATRLAVLFRPFALSPENEEGP